VFCSVCKSEYRAGFTKCSDCGSDLVEHSPEAAPADTSDLALAWRGSDPSAFSAALAALQSAGISSYQISDHNQLVWGFALPRPQYQIVVRKGDLHVANELVAPFGERPAFAHAKEIWKGPAGSGVDIAKEPTGQDLRGADAPDDIPADFDPKDATSEIWSGDDKQMAQTFKDCLREVGIGCVIAAAAGKRVISVLPSSAARAKEIIREIVEQTPPE
jgi:hypothetical protein